MVSFLTTYEKENQRTNDYCKACNEKGLFKEFEFTVQQKDREPESVKGLYTLDKNKLLELSDEDILKWFKNDWLSWSYAHLHSLGTLSRLAKLGG